jgi:competence protein ComEA
MVGRRRRLEAELGEQVRARLAHLLADGRSEENTLPSPLGARRQLEPAEPDLHAPAPARFRRVHLHLVVGLLVLGLVGAGWGLLRARPVALATPVGPSPTAESPASAAAPSPATPGPTPSGGPSAQILVHVLGAVVRPGVVSLPAQSRVLDAINAAGGLRRRANPGDLNLAQVLSDGEQVLIGTKAKPAGEVRQGGGGPATRRGTGSAATRGGQAQVDLNAATEAELETLPGIGPVTAAKITAWRDQHGRFTRVEELQEIDGIGPKTFAQLAEHVRV